MPTCTAVAEDPSVDRFRARRADGTATRPASATLDSVALTLAMYLLDTNVVSELRKPRPNPKVVAWIEDIGDSDLHLSAVTIGEIQAGIEATRTQNPAKADELEVWARQV